MRSTRRPARRLPALESFGQEMKSRYEGKPLLRLIELYVIDAIGELAPKEEGTTGHTSDRGSH